MGYAHVHDHTGEKKDYDDMQRSCDLVTFDVVASKM